MLNIKDWLDYNPETGVFTWVKPRKGIKLDKVAGRLDKNGYITICFNYKYYKEFLEEHDGYNVVLPDGTPYYIPWNGYFESLGYLEVGSAVVK